MSDIPNELGSRVRATRRARGLSQRETADIIGVDPATVHRWETGKGGPPTERNLPAIEAFLAGRGSGALVALPSIDVEEAEEPSDGLTPTQREVVLRWSARAAEGDFDADVLTAMRNSYVAVGLPWDP